MKKISLIILSTIYILFFFSERTFAQECEKLLQGGLYSFTNMTNTGSFSKDLKTYYLTEQFKTDMKSGKWGSSLTLPIDGLPITLGMDFDENQYKEFKSRLLQSSELKINSDNYKTVFSTVPNTNLYQAYIDCITIGGDKSKTGFIQGTNIETDNTVVFLIYYRPQAPGDPMPIVQDFRVEPFGSVLSGNLIEGQRLNSFSILITCKRDPEKDLVLSLKTDRGSLISKSIAEGSFTSSSNIPIGTVIASFLSFEEFCEATKNNEKSLGGIWTSAKSNWAPCDGRPLPYSKYSKYASSPNAPDLRGLFLRGYNSFDPSYTVPPSEPSQREAEPSPIGIYQPDAVKKHQHRISKSKNVLYFREGGNLKGGGGAAFMNAINNPDKGDGPLLQTDDNEGDNENRPKNISIYYYIKIN